MKKFIQKYFTVSVLGYYFGQLLGYGFLLLLAVTIGTPVCKLLYLYSKFLWNLL